MRNDSFLTLDISVHFLIIIQYYLNHALRLYLVAYLASTCYYRYLHRAWQEAATMRLKEKLIRKLKSPHERSCSSIRSSNCAKYWNRRD